ncbi:hypothetical protein HMF8227_00058 [Saliniradius amylolyticus]|uniref:Glycosyltransferase 2-like domain-containing protein n=1 Tax=Saliniradius amylolyticus TaxID=2183582 RepID=A0A2S2DYW7_9ALTE|nr:glycosyltransferase family 2 protein [Saliniradius amylolyticus]AWL10566.1 hypothetical protein HMF8227_00058 [Saliniradius amylolyticus]
MSVSVIFSTYNSPDWMEKVLWGFHYQTYKNFEVVIADDGSDDNTRERIEVLKQHTNLSIQHIWQPDDGFQKTRILNKALVASQGEYIIFTDGDCIPRNDFIETHIERRRQGCYLSGGYFKLPMQTSQAITPEDIAQGHPFNVDWLVQHGLKKTHKTMKLTAKGWKAELLNKLTPARPTWNGHNASGWREDIFAANGFDERMQYGGEDCELGERLVNAGIKPIGIRYSTTCVHLEHARGYVRPEMIRKNLAIRAHTRKAGVARTPYGIESETSARTQQTEGNKMSDRDKVS